MTDDKEYRERQEDRKTRLAGILMTVGLHAAALCLVSFSGLKYLYPPPQEKSVLISFEEEIAEVLEEEYGKEPQAEEVNKDEAVRLVQKSEAPKESEKPNLTPQTQSDPFGDVPVDDPPAKEEPKLDPRASFPGMAKRDTSLTAAHSASQKTERYTEGQPSGNTLTGRTDGRPNAQVKGRNTVGQIARPVYNVQESGIVVVDIWVDNYGNVVKAVPGGDGTTVLNKSLYTAARNAAMETHFNQSAEAPTMQEGTITYYFNLK